MGPYRVVKVLPNHTYQVEHSRQISVQSEQRLEPYHASPDAVGQAPPAWSPIANSILGESKSTQGVEIFVWRRPEPDPKLEPPSLPGQLEPQALGSASTLVGNGPTRSTGEGGDPLHLRAEKPPTPQEPVSLEMSQIDRIPPIYLADYHVEHIELLS